MDTGAILKVERAVMEHSLSPHRVPPALSGWQKAKDENGKPYYWQVETGKTCWQLPQHASIAGSGELIDAHELGGWRAIMDQRKGKPYFWHCETGAVVWRMPVAYAKAMSLEEDMAKSQQGAVISIRRLMIIMQGWLQGRVRTTLEVRPQSSPFLLPSCLPGFLPAFRHLFHFLPSISRCGKHLH